MKGQSESDESVLEKELFVFKSYIGFTKLNSNFENKHPESNVCKLT